MTKSDAFDPDAPESESEPTPDELREAKALAAAIESGTSEFATALRMAHAPTSIPADEHEALVRTAVARANARARRNVVVRVAFGAAAAVALAASIALWLHVDNPSNPAGEAQNVTPLPVDLVSVHSTQPLFAEPFARTGGASRRIDRITLARAADHRENRFRTWGVR